MTEWVDLHLHSNHSDGTESPEQLVARVAAAGATAMALTDHDTVAGVAAAREAAMAAGIGFLDGVEISAVFEGREMHVVGLNVSIQAEPLTQLLGELADMRRNRMDAIHAKLRRVGIVVPHAPDMQAPGRMHVATALRDMGKAATVQQAFDRYLNSGGPAYVPKELPDVSRVIAAIHAAEGLAFIAHPGLGHWAMKRLERLLALPFDGLEAWHPSHTPAVTNRFLAVAQQRDLLVSGGSDCHGNVKGEGCTLGRVKTPACHYHRINAARQPMRY